MLINDLYTNKTPAVTEANDPNFVGFMNNTLGDRVDAKPEQPKTGHDWYDNAPTMSMDNMPSYKHAFKFGMSVLQSMDAETKQHFAEADNDELFSYLMKLARKKKFEPKYFVEEDMFEVTGLFSEIFHDPSMADWEWADLLRSTLNNQGVAEGVLDEAVGMMIKGAAISGPDDQDIADQIAARTGGRVDSGSRGHHILITYPTTQHRAAAAVKIRKMFPGIELYKSGGNRNTIDEQGVAEGLQQTLRKVVPGYAKREIDKKMDAEKFGRRDVDKDANFQRYKKIQDKLKEQGVAEAQTDYQKRRQRERDVDAGKPVKPEPRNPQNDYFARRKKEKEQGMAEGNPVAGQDFTMKDGAQMKWNPASKSWQQQAPVPGNDGFDVVSGSDTEHTIDTGNKSTGTYTSTDIFKNPNTGQQKSLATWDHTDPATGKNYSGSNDIDQYGNATTQKNYEESQDQLDELDKKTVASWVRQQPERIKGDTGLSRTNFKKAKRLVDKSIPSAIAKYKDPGYGKQEKRMDEVSLGKYREKATVDKALAQANKFFGRDDPAAVAAADRTIAKRERGLGRADARSRPYTAPPVDQDKQRRDLADKYPNIDELVRRAELRRDPQYDRADGQAYYNGRDAEQNYHKLKQIQRMIRGAELDEMDFGGVGQVTDSDTGDVTTNFSQGPLSVSQTKTPGGYTKQTDQQYNLGAATLGARTVGPNIGAGQLAGTTTKTATNNMTGQAKQQVKGVGFGGASGATVGKNYVGSSDDELSKYAADSATGINEEPDQVTVDVPGSSFTADKSTNTLSGTTNVHGVNINATKDMTPGGATTFSANMNVAPNLNIAATQKSADYNKGQLAGTKSVAAKYTDTTGALGQPGQQHTATRTAGVGFGGASGANVGKNYVDQYSVNESVDRIRHLAGIKPAR